MTNPMVARALAQFITAAAWEAVSGGRTLADDVIITLSRGGPAVRFGYGEHDWRTVFFAADGTTWERCAGGANEAARRWADAALAEKSGLPPVPADDAPWPPAGGVPAIPGRPGG